ncbi:MAG: hypothetical protein IKC49_03205 [Clostridia bacterium]|nr:hypothetical protein [Clostridia bacterium]
MKVISYATNSKNGFQKVSEEEFAPHMKELHRQKIAFIPMVLVEGIPGESKSKWITFNEYKKKIKEGGEYGSKEENS